MSLQSVLSVYDAIPTSYTRPSRKLAAAELLAETVREFLFHETVYGLRKLNKTRMQLTSEVLTYELPRNTVDYSALIHTPAHGSDETNNETSERVAAKRQSRV